MLEGGSIDVNGRGTLLTTEECLLCDGPGPQPRARAGRSWSELFADYLGVSHVIWLGRGHRRATTPTATSTTWPGSSTPARSWWSSSETRPTRTTSRLQDDLRPAGAARCDQDGEPLRVVPLPMPEPVVFDGQRLPASYANFYIANAAVLVPTFNDPADRVALDTLAELFPGRRVVGIHAVDLVWGLGTLHCLTQQQPA